MEVHFHPTDSNKYYALVNSYLIRSNDKGVTWNDTLVYDPLNPNSTLEALKFHPTNPDTMYLATRNSNSKLYRTFNGGASWTNITDNFYTPSTNPNVITTIPTINIDVSRQFPNNLYSGFEIYTNDTALKTSTSAARFYRSADLGTTKVQMAIKTQNVGYYIGSNKNILLVNPLNDSDIVVGGVKNYRLANRNSISGGVPQVHDDMRGGHYVNGMLALATDGGISVSFDSGYNYSLRSGKLDVQQGYAHAIDKDYKYLVTAKQDIGFFRFDIQTKIWLRTGGGEGGLHYVSPFNPTVSVGNQYTGGAKSNNYVVGWKNNGLTGFYVPRTTNDQWHSAHARPFIQLNDSNYYVGLEDLYFRDTLAKKNSLFSVIEHWTKYTDFDGSGFKGDTINDFIVSIVNSDIDTNLLIVGFGNTSWNRDENNVKCPDTVSTCLQKKLLISHDKGLTWSDKTVGTNLKSNGRLVELPIRYSNLTDVTISTSDPGKIWTTFGGYSDYAGSFHKVYFSPDTGNTWFDQTFDLPNFPVLSIAYQPNSDDRLFVSTILGVYTKQGNETTWTCYTNNLPPATYTHIDINNCGGAITVNANGRGIWKSPLPANHLVGNITWNGTRNVGSDLIIADTLTIIGTVEMAVGAKITVEPGGKLILDGGTITSSHCLDGMWKGIELLGDASKNQYGDPMATNYQQGYVELKNGGVIENAEIGIYAGSYAQTGMGGGKIKMVDAASQIKNCRIGVQIEPYAKHNTNTFKDGTFVNDGTFTDPLTSLALITETHVKIKGVTIVGNEFDGVTFENLNTNLLPSERGVGIEVVGRKVGTTSNPMAENCTFTDLLYGILAGNLASGAGNDIENNTFDNVVRGIYILSGYSVDIKSNTFDLPNATTQDVYGLKLNGHYNFDIRSNTINGGNAAPSGTATSAGIVIENSIEAGGIVFDNTIGNGQFLETGIQAQGDNQSLTIRCNDIEYQGNNPHGIAVYDYLVIGGTDSNQVILANDPAQLRDQGHPNCRAFGNNAADAKAAAGNEWINLCSSGTDEEIDMEPGMEFKYFFHRENQFNQLTTEPDCSDPNWNSNLAIYVNCGINKTSNSCDDLYTPPTSGGGGGGTPGGGGGFFRMKGGSDSVLLGAYEADYLNAATIQTQMASRSNGNSTVPQLIQSIELFSSNSISTLVTASPLSDEVLLAAIENWSTSNTAELKQVLTENVPLSKELWTALQQQQLAHVWKQDLNAAAVQHVLRDSLSRAASYLRFTKKELTLKEAQLYRKLTVDSNFTEAEVILDSSLLSASFRLLAKEYINKNEFSKAQSLLTRIEQKVDDGELKVNLAFAVFNRQMISIYQNGKSANPADLPKATVEKLQYNNGPKGDEAEALFALLSNEFKHHPVVKKRRTHQYQNPPEEGINALSKFSIFPNPSNGMATIVYELEGDENATLQVFDVSGRLVKIQTLATQAERQQIDISYLNNGIYHFSVTFENERLFNGKLVLTK